MVVNTGYIQQLFQGSIVKEESIHYKNWKNNPNIDLKNAILFYQTTELNKFKKFLQQPC